ncbi:ComF family protein [Pacificimonas sp. WHA3]|uniref:ComF family protein n=1 Tax=Pacificimonas pallii TaxID=2827236 RepID=A0ABS6SHC3_9SPHN|nr:ComF family protein [Pacificimonas pallii]MBV7257828.1 ComF family protein [Pacificimonas pallii]
MQQLGSHMKRAAATVLDLILPPRCPGCREIVDSADRFCAECWETLGFITDPMCATCGLPFAGEFSDGVICGECAGATRPYDHARAAMRYEGAAVPVLLGLKHGGRTHLSRLIAEALQRHVRPDTDLIVPVPLDRARLAKRGYNQAGLIARALSRRSGVPLGIDTLIRTKPTRSTAGLSRAARFRAAQGAFAAPKRLRDGSRVILIDDVMTTGATAEAACRALRKAGAARIDVLVYARAALADA